MTLKKSNSNYCCGAIGPLKPSVIDSLPPNPKLKSNDTSELVFIGSGELKVNTQFGNVYYVSDFRRILVVLNSELDSFLEEGRFILRPTNAD